VYCSFPPSVAVLDVKTSWQFKTVCRNKFFWGNCSCWSGKPYGFLFKRVITLTDIRMFDPWYIYNADYDIRDSDIWYDSVCTRCWEAGYLSGNPDFVSDYWLVWHTCEARSRSATLGFQPRHHGEHRRKVG
jgi:hypothetical protein